MYIRLTITALLWSGAFFAVKEVIERVPVYTGATLRFIIASFFLLIIMFAYSQKPSFRTTKQKLEILFLATTGIFIYNLFFFMGLKLTTAVNGSLIVAANPAMTALISQIWKKESSSALRWLGISISFVGLLFVFSRGSLEIFLSLNWNSGYILLAGSSLCWALYSIKGREVLQTQPVIGTTAFACLIGAFLLFPIAILEWIRPDMLWYSKIPGFLTIQESKLTDPLLWMNLFYLGIFASGIAFLFWYQGVRALGAPRSAIFVNLVPVFAMMLSIAGGQMPEIYQWLGGAIVIAGVYLTNRT